ncbi:hypothetical protein AXG93_1862s1030 [Marchantia polymorpha subsp. ruderalis]|uniref:Uncharacterized protein n=1 Tax=Marchantia polymorpha subsp. ruderalis TaxID=1480154 RepID=A0A176WAP6_MARPO|nr:hypothetical protein AXG93_1862s1030 [Marchantia polymorpha subsp. ruderalis]
MSSRNDGVEPLMVMTDLRRIYNLIDIMVYSQQLVRRHKAEAQAFVEYLKDLDCTLHEKAAILYPDSYGLLSRGWHKQLHELEELLRSAQELLKDLAEPLHLFTHATERFKELRAKMTECLNLMTILLLFVPPDHMGRQAEPLYTLSMLDPPPAEWYQPPPPQDVLLETRTASLSSRGVEGGQRKLTRTMTYKKWRRLNEMKQSHQHFSDLFSYVDNSEQAVLLNTCFENWHTSRERAHPAPSPYFTIHSKEGFVLVQ